MKVAAKACYLLAVYLLTCGHDAPAPAPDLANGDKEIHPLFVDCPVCGMPRRVLGYEARP